MGVGILSFGRALALVVMVFALVGVALSFSGYTQQGLLITDADYSTHTKAFCSPQEGMLYCEDKLVIEHSQESYIAKNSEITGNAFIETL